MIIKILFLILFILYLILRLFHSYFIIFLYGIDNKHPYSISTKFAFLPVFVTTWRKNEIYLVWLQNFQSYYQNNLLKENGVNKLGIFSIKFSK